MRQSHIKILFKSLRIIVSWNAFRSIVLFKKNNNHARRIIAADMSA